MKLEKMKAKIFLEIVLPVKTMLELKPNLEQKGISSMLSDFPKTFELSGKLDSFKQIIKRCAYMHESPG